MKNTDEPIDRELKIIPIFNLLQQKNGLMDQCPKERSIDLLGCIQHLWQPEGAPEQLVKCAHQSLLSLTETGGMQTLSFKSTTMNIWKDQIESNIQIKSSKNLSPGFNFIGCLSLMMQEIERALINYSRCAMNIKSSLRFIPHDFSFSQKSDKALNSIESIRIWVLKFEQETTHSIRVRWVASANEALVIFSSGELRCSEGHSILHFS